ncbi:ribonucleoside reductase class II [Candidatus Gottesmanbacteria bacterium]|nr:ribonucleoside reductase class II [Candidatus Gottesmanbacteria bacterium]
MNKLLIKKIKKRDGRIVAFEPEKIFKAIEMSGSDTGEYQSSTARKICDNVLEKIAIKYKEGSIPSVEEIQDVVEPTIAEAGFFATAKHYILYRQEHAKIRKAQVALGIPDDVGLPLNSLRVLEARYLVRDQKRNIKESPRQLFERVARTIATMEKKWGGDKAKKKYEEEFFGMMTRREFIPNSPTLMNAGTGSGQLSACFVIPVADDMGEIFNAVRAAALIHQTGGGTGFSFSRLRPKGDVVGSTGGIASGPVSFMRVFNMATEVIKQGGKRRGANMGILRVDHPDILDFISCKEDMVSITNFNISVTVTEKFMKAVEKNAEYELINPHTKEVAGKLNARMVFDLIVLNAWKNGDPGIIFIDRINRDNPTSHIAEIEATNPCIAKGTFVCTNQCLVPINEVVDKQNEKSWKLLVDHRVTGGEGTHFWSLAGAYSQGKKNVWKLTTKSGFSLAATPDHKIMTTRGWVELAKLKSGEDKVLLQPQAGVYGHDKKLPFVPQNLVSGQNGRVYRFNFPNEWSKELGQVLGLLVGDGWLRTGDKNCRVGFTFSDEDKKLLDYFRPILNKWYGRDIKSVNRKNTVWHLSYHGKFFCGFFQELGVKGVKAIEKEVPKSIFAAPKEGVVGFLQGIFSADGTVRNSKKSNSDWLALTSKSKKLLEGVQLLLLNLGIKSRIFDRSRKPRKAMFPYLNKNGQRKTYTTDGILYELGIFGEFREKFKTEIRFLSKKKQDRLNDIHHRIRLSHQDQFLDPVLSVEKWGKDDVYDLTEAVSHSMIVNGIVAHQCGEQPLMPYDSCNLGSINLDQMLKVKGFDEKTKTTKYEIDWEKLEKTTRLSTRFLDDVIEANKFPLGEIDKVVRANRTVGLGIMGWADLLVDLRIPYMSNEAVSLGEKVMKFITEKGRDESVKMGKERGSFKNFPGSSWQKKGYKYMRNRTVTTIAPTGTIGLIADCSQGIEPIFALAHLRRSSLAAQENLGDELYYTYQKFEEELKRRSLYSEELMAEVAKSGAVGHLNHGLPEDLKKIYVTAHEITPIWHLKMQAAFQKYTDNAVSKTVNFAKEAMTQDVEEVYMLAYKLGCKGVTIYRDSSRPNQVLNLDVTGRKKHEEEKKTVPQIVTNGNGNGNGNGYSHTVIDEPPSAPATDTRHAYMMASLPREKTTTNCPTCGGLLAHHEGCVTCLNCGYSYCSV